MKISTAALVLGGAAVAAAEEHSFTEINYDFTGKDIGNLPGTDIDNCFVQCVELATGNCNAVTYTAYNGGMCWFKESRGETIPKVGANSTAVYNKQQAVCSIEYDTDYEGNDIANKKAASTECCGICTAYPGCRAFSWSNANGGTCWLKSKLGLKIQKEGVQSAVAYPDVGEGYAVDTDLDYVDHDIGNKPSATAQGCFDICTKFPACVAFTWTNYLGGTCWLKAAKDQTVAKTGAISGFVGKKQKTCGWREPNYDYYGHDLASRSGVPNAKDCCGVCQSYEGCARFSWSNYLGGTCWLKTAVADDHVVPKVGVSSGWVNVAETASRF